MTSDKDLKRLVRTRMRKTGESYTTARAQLLKKPRPAANSAPTPPAEQLAGMSDTRILTNTGHTWDEWVRLLDARGAAAMPHREIARLVSDQFGVGPWWTQAVTVGYERIKGLRAIGQRRDGTYEAHKSRTFAVAVGTLFDAWTDAAMRRRWLDVRDVRVRTATRPRTMRLEWRDGTIVSVGFTAKGRKSSVAVQHTKLPDRGAADRMKKFWSAQLDSLARVLAE